MVDAFKIEIFQTQDDKINENNKQRICTIRVPDNSSLKEFRVQLPISYEGPKNEHGLEIAYTPEHLFVSAISSCFFTTFSVVSSNSNLKYLDFHIDAKGVMGTSTGTKIMEKIDQLITLTIPSNMNEKKALKVLELTEKRCPLANSVKSIVENKYIVKKND